MALDPALDQLAPQANPMPPAPIMAPQAPPPVPQQGPPLGAPGEVGPPQIMLSPTPVAKQDIPWPEVHHAPANYINPPPNRSSGELGKPWWPTVGAENYPGTAPGPFSPQPSEMYSVMANANGQLASWAPAAVAQPASNAASLAQMLMPMANLLTGGQFGRNYNAASLGRLRAAREQLQFENDKRDAAYTSILQQYGGILSLGEADPKFDTKDALYHAAWVNHDYPLMKVIADQGVPAAYSYLQHMDAVHRMAQAGGTTLRQSTKDDNDAANDAAYGISDPGRGGGGAAGEGGLFGGLPNLTKGAGSAAQPAPGAAAPPEAGSFDDQYMKKSGTTAAVMQTAHAIVNGGKPANPPGSTAQRQIGDAVRAINTGLSDAADLPAEPGDNSQQTAEKRIAAAKKVDANRGALIESAYEYNTDITKADKDTRNAIEPWLQRASGGRWSADNYAVAKEYKDPKGKDYLTMTRAKEVAQDYLKILAASKELGNEDQSIPRNIIQMAIQENVTGAGKYETLANALRDFHRDMTALASLTGNIKVGVFNKMMEYSAPTQSPRSLRMGLAIPLADAFTVTQSSREGWNAIGRRDLPPGVTARQYKTLRDEVRMNPKTGQAASDSVQELLAVSNNDPSKWNKSLSANETQTPLRWDQLQAFQNFVNDPTNLESEDPVVQAKLQFAREQIGVVQGLTDIVPGLDDVKPNASR